MKRVLVTGAGGFLGRALVGALTARGAEVVAAGHGAEHGVDFRLPEAVFELVAQARPDAVVHLAGTSRAADHARGPADVQTENVVHPLFNVLDATPRRRVVLVSTAAVYGVGAPDETAPPRPVELWAAARASAERMGLRRAAELGTDLRIVRPFFLLGPDVPVPSEVGSWLRSAERGELIQVRGFDILRDVLDVRDAALGIIELLVGGSAGCAYNLVAERPVSTHTIVTRLCPRSELRFDEAGRATPLVGAGPGLSRLGWAPRIPLEQTFADTALRARER